MRLLLYTLLLVSGLLALQACNNQGKNSLPATLDQTQQALQGTWIVDMPKTEKELIAEIQAKKQGEAAKKEIENALALSKAMFGELEMQFQNNGQAEVRFDGQNLKGKWELKAQGKELLITNPQGQTTNYTLLSLSAKEMRLQAQGAENSLVLVKK